MSRGNPFDATQASNRAVIAAEMDWLSEIIRRRIEAQSGEHDINVLAECCPPDLRSAPGAYADALRDDVYGAAERLVLALALAPHVAPFVLDPLSIHNPALGRRFTEFGGVSDAQGGGLMPTGETALYLLAGLNVERRLEFHTLFDPENHLWRQMLDPMEGAVRQPTTAHPLIPMPETYARLVQDRDYDPPFSAEFPAQRLSTALDWEDLVVSSRVMQQLHDVLAWLRHEPRLMTDWQLHGRILPGYRCLFHGPSGTGKTLAASLLGKSADMPVFRVDLSKVISKYIGETEKNLGSLFDRAAQKRWILFFDEADALFGTRGEVDSASDRAANQSIAYLLQRIETFDGVTLLASNLPKLMDQAFYRRFQSVVAFARPDAEQRLILWRNAFEGRPFGLAEDVDFPAIARAHDVTGAEIVNVLRMACLRVAERGEENIRKADLAGAIREEMGKVGRYG